MENRVTQAGVKWITAWINRYACKEGIELTKIRLGVEILLISVIKLCIVYSLAITLGVLEFTLITHGAFMLVKRYSFGLHALNSTVCTISSCFMFVLVPWMLSGVAIGNQSVILVFIVVISVLFLFAPADTKSRPLIGAKRRTQLRIKAVICGIVLFILTLLIPSEQVKFLLVLGAVYQSVAILPLTYILLGRSRKNYERYELA